MTDTELFQQCVHTLSRFYHCVDSSDYETLATLVTEDTMWQRKGESLKGPKAILAALQQRDLARKTSHQITNLYVLHESDPEYATAYYYVNVFDNQAPEGGLQLKTIMKSCDRFQLRDGRWSLISKHASKLI